MNRSYIANFFVLFIPIMAASGADSISGLYEGPGGTVVEIGTLEGKNTYTIRYGDITQGYKNCDFDNSDLLDVCALFDVMDILIPRDPKVGEEYRYMGSVVRVEEHHPVMRFGNTVFCDIFKLVIERSGTFELRGKVMRRPGGKRSFELLYSGKDGLIGLGWEKNARQSLFIIDWRSLEERRIEGRVEEPDCWCH